MQQDETIIDLDQLNEIVSDALTSLRLGDQQRMAQNALATSSLISPHLLDGDPPSIVERAGALDSFLRWVVSTFEPDGVQSWHDPNWRTYNILNGYFVERMLAADVAEMLGVVEQTFYEWRRHALTVASAVVQQELHDPVHAAQRHTFALLRRYQTAAQPIQTIIQILALLHEDEHLPEAWLAEFVPHVTLTDLLQSQLTIPPQLTLKPQLRAHISSELRVRRQWHLQLADLCDDAGDYFFAARHFMLGNRLLSGVQVLLDDAQAIRDSVPPQQIEALIDDIKPSKLRRHPDLAARLHILRGELAESVDNLPAASAAYEHALGAPDLLIKTTAYLRRVRVLKHIDLDACLGHLAVILDLLERLHDRLDDELNSHFGRLYIERAWLFIQEFPDAQRATDDLERASQVLPPADTALWCEYHNARAGHVTHFKLDDALQSREIEMRQQAWVAAAASGRSELMMRMAHNLGQAYVFSADYDAGLSYLTRCLELAVERDNLNVQAAAHKGIGGCYFFQRKYAAAQTAYERAYALFEEMENATWLAITTADLVELHATIGDFAAARDYLVRARNLSNIMGNERYQAWVTALNTRFPALQSIFNERQSALLHHLANHSPISRQGYVDLVGVSKSQAFRDLEELLEEGVIERIGVGRGTRYQLAHKPN